MKLSNRNYAVILDKALAETDSDHARERVMKDFAKLLFNDSKTSRLSEIIEIWKSLYNKRHGLIDVSIETADKDIAFPHSFAGKRVATSIKVNPSLIGGSIIRISDYIIDSSLRGKINALKQ